MKFRVIVHSLSGSCVMELCCRILPFEQEVELVKACVSLCEVIYKIRECLEAFMTGLKNFVIPYSFSCMLPRVFLLLHFISPLKVCYSLHNLSLWPSSFFT